MIFNLTTIVFSFHTLFYPCRISAKKPHCIDELVILLIRKKDSLRWIFTCLLFAILFSTLLSNSFPCSTFWPFLSKFFYCCTTSSLYKVHNFVPSIKFLQRIQKSLYLNLSPLIFPFIWCIQIITSFILSFLIEMSRILISVTVFYLSLSHSPLSVDSENRISNTRLYLWSIFCIHLRNFDIFLRLLSYVIILF